MPMREGNAMRNPDSAPSGKEKEEESLRKATIEGGGHIHGYLDILGRGGKKEGDQNPPVALLLKRSPTLGRNSKKKKKNSFLSLHPNGRRGYPQQKKKGSFGILMSKKKGARTADFVAL